MLRCFQWLVLVTRRCRLPPCSATARAPGAARPQTLLRLRSRPNACMSERRRESERSLYSAHSDAAGTRESGGLPLSVAAPASSAPSLFNFSMCDACPKVAARSTSSDLQKQVWQGTAAQARQARRPCPPVQRSGTQRCAGPCSVVTAAELNS